jgi:hypothetical protein
MTFEQALIQLKKGNRLQRTGWIRESGYDYIVLMGGYNDIHPNKMTAEKHGLSETAYEDKISIRPYIAMRDVECNVICAWTNTHADILANDWVLIET